MPLSSVGPSNPNPSSNKPLLRVALNHIDCTVATAGPLDNTSLPKVPILRVYGNSSTGRKACVHIHQVYPYFFIDYVGSLRPKDVKRYVHKLIRSLNHAVALSLKRNPESPTSRYIRAAILVKGLPFYGFHTSYAPFLKIYLADPALVNRVVTILRDGIVMKTCFRTYESHLSFPLQFMCDFGLYGCGFVELSGGWERCNEETDDLPTQSLQPSPHFRQSRLPLEMDVIAPQILNRDDLTARNMAFDVRDPPPIPSDEKLLLSVKELWEDESNRRRAKGLNPSPEIPVEPTASSRGTGGDWVAEARYWEVIRMRIESDALPQALPPKSHSWEHRVMTTFESIEALWEDNWRTWKPSGPPSGEEYDQEHEVDPDLPLDIVGDPQDLVEVDLDLLSTQEQAVEEDGGLERGDDYEAEPHPLEAESDDEDDRDEQFEGDEEEEAEDDDEVLNPSDGDARCPEDPFGIDDSSVALEGERIYKLKRQKSPPLPSDKLNVPMIRENEASPIPSRAVEAERLTGVTRELDLDETNDVRSPSPSDRVGGKRKTLTSEDDHVLERIQKKRKVTISDQVPECIIPEMVPTQPDPATPMVETKADVIIAKRTVQLSRVYQSLQASNSNRYQYTVAPPTRRELERTLDNHGVAHRLYRVPYYSNPADAPERPKEYGGLVFHLKGNTLEALEDWNAEQNDRTLQISELDSEGTAGWEYASSPPSSRQTRKWLATDAKLSRDSRPKKKWQSQIEGPTQANIYGFKDSPAETKHGIRSSTEFNILCLEIFAPTDGDGLPDPERDEIVAAFYALQTSGQPSIQAGVMAVNLEPIYANRLREFSIEYSDNELDLIHEIIDAVTELDPDIIAGWEIQKGSWGYLEARAKFWGLDLSELIGRAPPRHRSSNNDIWASRQTSTFQTIGRYVFNTWRLMRSEHTLTIYTFENVAFHVLQRRFPKYTLQTLTRWFRSPTPAHVGRLFNHMKKRACMVLEMIEESEVVTKSAEFARVFGIDFFSVISRGSQFKVESFMVRIAKPESFVLISPSKADVGKQNAAECMPLIMEPTSALYTSPLVVLDFQSLYPSVMIAYNYCYSTCLGRVQDFQGEYKLGVSKLDLPEGLLAQLKDDITVAPNGIMYVKPKVRRGLLGRMLTELLDTRVMVKQAMKSTKSEKALTRVLDARQLALKFIANVTYGYTSATFSGRMPAVEIADSIVQTGRETLEKAIMLVNNTKKWNAQVVYGDTDSLFIYLRGRTKEEAFRLGYEMAATVTAMNPVPIKLKFEKVYLPGLLMAKKRYVGFKYETVDAAEPGFDAKGIETVRRDGVLAQRKMTENCLKILFRTQDLSLVKDYCYRSWNKLIDNKASAQDFIFAKEIRMGTYSDNAIPPPGVIVAARRMMQDPNYEPQYAERVPYLIAKGELGDRLVDRAMDPEEFLDDKSNQLDAEYYITKVLIPPLERIFNLVGADVKQWYQDMPKPAVVAENPSPGKYRRSVTPGGDPHLIHVDIGMFNTLQCLVCGEPSYGDLCESCDSKTEETMANLGSIVRNAEKRMADAQLVCASCTGGAPTEPIECVSLDCPWFYARHRADEDISLMPLYQELGSELALDMDAKLSQLELEEC